MGDFDRSPLTTPTAPEHRHDLADLSDVAIQPSVASAVDAVRDVLGLEVAYASEHVDGLQHFRCVSGDAMSFGVAQDLAVPLEMTYCHRVLSGRLPNVIPDARGDDRAAALPVTQAANIGAYISVPIRFSSGELYGTLCAASHEAEPELGYRDLQFLHVFARLIADQLERDRHQEVARVLELQATAASTLIAALEARDGYTGAHSEAVVGLAGEVAERLGLDPLAIAEVRQAALLHDVGKIAIPDAILHKPGALDDEEWEVMRSHPVRSESIVRDTPALSHLGRVVRAEHERWDGGGYPDGLAGEDIPLASRITFVCDAYHAMTSDRPYRDALPESVARAEIENGVGTQFCPHAATALLAALDAR